MLAKLVIASLYAKALAAAALVFGVRIVELETFVQAFAHVIQFGSVEIDEAFLVDHDLDAVAVENEIAVERLIDKFKFVGHAGTAGRFDAQAHTEPFTALADEMVDVPGGARCQDDAHFVSPCFFL